MWTESNILIDVECSVNSYYGYKIGMEIVCKKGTISLPLPAEPIVRSRLKVGHEIMDNWAKHFPKAYDNELQHSINHLRSTGRPQVNGAAKGRLCSLLHRRCNDRIADLGKGRDRKL